MSAEPKLTDHKITVLLIDDQPLIGEAVRRMIAAEPDIAYHFCKDAARALELAGSVGATVILLDLVMPGIDGLSLVKLFRANEPTRETPLIVLSTKEEPTTKAEAFALGANDYLVKLPDTIELLARIRHHSKGYINLLQRNEAYQALQESQQMLANDVSQAARYVRSLLPEPRSTGSIRTDWRFIPSTDLGGDSFGYDWLDDEHFAFYLLDVSGHGVGAALLSVSVLNALRSQSLPQTDFRQPGQVLSALNRAFQMDQQNGLYFTIWYGIYSTTTRRIEYAGGGHPPALLLAGPTAEQATMKLLSSQGPMIGADIDFSYESESCTVDPFGRLFLFSDGVYEITRTDNTMWPFHDFIAFMSRVSEPSEGDSPIDRLIDHTVRLGGTDEYQDDFSIVEFQFESRP
jgi:sigma-B regulation protein RsbU (phosphoserine phosphatase)